MIQVDILVLTYRRTQLLAETLRSIAGQLLPEDVSLRIIVVDNDAEESASAVVHEFAAGCPLQVSYLCEPVANIAKARNRALAQVDGDFSAFIDDDEQAVPDWVAQLLEAQARFAVPVVFGPVLPTFPDGTPEWIRRGGFFDRPRFATGTQRQTGGTGNVLLRMAAVRDAGMAFDEGYGNAGSDTDFFRRFRSAGARAVWCDEAVVYETVLPDRTNAKWLIDRSYSRGYVYARTYEGRLGFVGRMRGLLKHGVVVGVCALVMVPALCLGRLPAVRVGRRGALSLGRVVGLLATADH